MNQLITDTFPQWKSLSRGGEEVHWTKCTEIMETKKENEARLGWEKHGEGCELPKLKRVSQTENSSECTRLYGEYKSWVVVCSQG